MSSSLSRRTMLRGALVAGGALLAPGSFSRATAATLASGSTATRVDVRRFSSLQAAFDSGKPLIIPAGVTVGFSGSYLKVDPGLDLQVDGVLEKTGSPQNGGTSTSFIRNRHFDVPVDDLTIHGSGVIRAASHSMTGNLFGLSGNRIELRGFRVSCWAGGRCMVLDGDDIALSHLRLFGSPTTVGNGGIRVVGGQRFRAESCHVRSGDDALQFVPSGSPVDPLFDRSISSGRYVNCTGRSYSAKFMVVDLQGRSTGDPTDTTMTASVTDVLFDGCVGAGGVCATRVQNLSSSGVVRGVTFTDCEVDMGRSTVDRPTTTVLVRGEYGGGGVHRVEGDVTILRPRTTLKRVTGKTTNISVRVTTG